MAVTIQQLAQAITKAENSPPEWNNPGSLTGADKGSFQTCGFGNKEGVWKFVNRADGEKALEVKCARMLLGKSTVYPPQMDLIEVGLKYSGGNPNWSKNVAAILGVPETTTIAELGE
jgi:hypothetical protein